MERSSSVVGFAGLTALALLFANGGVRAPSTDSGSRDAIPSPGVVAADRSDVLPLCRGDLPSDTSRGAAGLPVCPTARDLLSGFAARGAPGTGYTFDVAIAVLPDPLASHLDWAFDSAIEAIRRAHERAGYVADRYWLPWAAQGDTSRNRLQRLLALSEERPGVMIFRRADPSRRDLRVVYVVGETPTSGIHREAFRRALAERDLLTPYAPLAPVSATRRSRAEPIPDTLHIVGPIFSGSIVSLALALRDWTDGASREKPRIVRIVSGGATDPRNRDALECEPGDALHGVGCAPFAAVHFSATVNPQNHLADVFDRRVRRPLGVDSSEVAYLREATTQYGRQEQVSDARRAHAASLQAASSGPAAPFAAGPLVIPFPMNISSLRAEYARNPDPVLGSGPPIGRTPHTRLEMLDPSTATENPATMSNMTPAGVELLLDQVARDLVAHRIRMLGITATDVRDKMFLAVEVKKRVRDIQLFTYGSNVLYLRPEYNEQLRGMYVVSTYPLFLENQWWARAQRSGERLSFASDIAEGTFNAMAAQLGEDAMLEEYGDPFAAKPSGAPPVWVTQVGRVAFSPLLYDTARARGSTGYLYVRSPTVLHPTGEFGWTRSRFAFTALLLTAAFVVAFLYLQVNTGTQVRQEVHAAVENRRRLLKLDASSPAARIERRGLEHITLRATLLLHREFYVLLRFIAICSVFVPLLILALRVRAHGQRLPAPSVEVFALTVIMGAFVVAVIALAGLQIWHVLRLDLGYCMEYLTRWNLATRGQWQRMWTWFLEVVVRSTLLAAGLMYAMATYGYVHQVMSLGSDAPVFYNRAVQGFSGVSPVVPLALAGLVFAVWASWHLTRVTILAETTAFEEACMSRRVFRHAEPVRLRDPGNASAREKYLLLSLSGESLPRYRDILDDRRAADAAERARTSTRHPAEQSSEDGGVARRTSVRRLTIPGIRRAVVASALASPSATVAAEDVVSVTSPPHERSSDVAGAGRGVGNPEVIDERREQSPASNVQRADVDRDKLARALPATSSMQLRAVSDGGAFANFRESVSDLRSRLAGGFADRGRDSRTPSARRSVRAVRDRLTLMIPGMRGAWLALGALTASAWMWSRFGRTSESVVFAAWVGGLSAFDVLFRIGVLGSMVTTVWGIYRLRTVWNALQQCLDAALNPRLLRAFERLPSAVPMLTRLSPFGIPSHSAIDSIVRQQWSRLCRIYSEDKRKYTAKQREVIGRVMDKLDGPPTISWDHHASPMLGEGYVVVVEVLEALWAMDPAGEAAPVDARDPASAVAPSPAPAAARSLNGGGTRRPYVPGKVRGAWKSHRVDDAAMLRWLDNAETFAAVYVVEYVEWVLRSLRYLALFLVLALVITTLLLSSYPFGTQNLFRLLYFFVFAGTVAALVATVFQIERNAALSHIAGTRADALDWRHGSLLSNVLLYGATPIVTMIGWEFPPVREFLFSWIAPALRLITK